MLRRQIRNLRSEKHTRLFDALIEDGKVTLELKNSKSELLRVPWDDVVYQVNAAKTDAGIETNK